MTVKFCHFCDHNIYPKGKPLFDLEADYAITTKNGEVKCQECIKQDLDKEILRYAPDSPAARNIIAERKSKEEARIKLEKFRKQPGERASFYEGKGLRRYRP